MNTEMITVSVDDLLLALQGVGTDTATIEECDAADRLYEQAQREFPPKPLIRLTVEPSEAKAYFEIVQARVTEPFLGPFDMPKGES